MRPPRPSEDRRHSAPLFTAGRLYAAPATGPRLLVVFLRGAYDAANIVIPTSQRLLLSARPNLAVPKDAALPLDTDWGLHPALKDSIYPLWQKKQIAFVPFAGTDDTQPLAFRDPGHHRAGPAGRRQRATTSPAS